MIAVEDLAGAAVFASVPHDDLVRVALRTKASRQRRFKTAPLSGLLL
jgi:hypothetical protein